MTETSAQTGNQDFKALDVSCPPGKRLVGGGSVVFGSISGVALVLNGPEPGGETTWRASAQEIAPQNSSWALHTTIYCMSATG